MTGTVLSPDSARLRPLVLFKRGPTGTVTALLDMAARQEFVGRCLALPEGAEEITLLQGIDDLARRLKTVSHPNLSHFERIVEGAGGTWMLFRYVDGVQLIQYLDRESDVSDGWILWWLYHILAGLDTLHRLDPPLVIGYLEPCDIIVRESNLWIVDLGLYEHIFSHASLAEHPMVHFIAPERRHAAAPVPADDLFSAGALAFWLVTGRAPVAGGTAQGGLLRQAMQAARPAFPLAVAQLVTEMLSFQASDRPTSAQAVLERLTPWVRDMRGEISPTPSDRSMQFAAEATRLMDTPPPPAPRPIVFPSTAVSAAPPATAAEEFLSDAGWAVRRRPWGAAGVVAALIGIAVGLSLRKGGTAPPTALLRVRSGDVVGRPLSTRRWTPQDSIVAGTRLAVLDREAVLVFQGTLLTVAPHSVAEYRGSQHDTLQLSLQSGQMEVRTGPREQVDLQVRSTHLVVAYDSDAEIDDRQIFCRSGMVRLQVGDDWREVRPGRHVPL